MTEAGSRTTRTGEPWRAHKRQWMPIVLGTILVLLSATVSAAWATSRQSPVRSTAPQPGSLVGTVYNDLNRNGEEDAHEKGIPGVQVTLLSGGTLALATTTNGLGNYGFLHLIPGKVYTVTETNLDLYSSTTTDVVELTMTPGGELVNFGDYRATILMPCAQRNYTGP